MAAVPLAQHLRSILPSWVLAIPFVCGTHGRSVTQTGISRKPNLESWRSFAKGLASLDYWRPMDLKLPYGNPSKPVNPTFWFVAPTLGALVVNAIPGLEVLQF